MDRQVAVFVLIIAAVLVVAVGVISLNLPPALTVAGLLGLAVVVLFFPRFVEFKEYERGVMFRFGIFQRVVGPGWVLLFSTMDSVEKIDMRTQVIDIKPQSVVTHDNINLKIDAVAYIRIVDPKKVVLEVHDVQGALTHRLYSEIRNIVGMMTIDEVVRKTDEINTALYSTLKDVEKDWGIVAQNVELQSVELPPGLLTAMQKRKEAGEYKAKLETEAEAKQISLEILDRAASKLSDKTMALLYVDALKVIAQGKSNKIIFPLELSRLASNIASKTGGEEKFDDIAQALIKAYTEKQKESLDSKKIKK